MLKLEMFQMFRDKNTFFKSPPQIQKSGVQFSGVELNWRNSAFTFTTTCRLLWGNTNVIVEVYSWYLSAGCTSAAVVQLTGADHWARAPSGRWSSAGLAWTIWWGGRCRRVKWRRRSPTAETSSTTDTSTSLSRFSLHRRATTTAQRRSNMCW